MLRAIGPPPEGQDEFYHNVKMRDGHENKVKIFKPRATSSPGPLVILVFGGGYFCGDADMPSKQARSLVRLFGATVVCIDYRLSPENKFPTCQVDAWDCTKWVAENATGDLLNADPSQGFVIGGVSAGADISAVLSRMAQEDKLTHPLTGQWLACPNVFHKDGVPDKYKDRYKSWFEEHVMYNGVPKEEIEMVTRNGAWDNESPWRYAGVSKAPLSAEHPRTYFQIAGMDPLRDDGLIYDEMLKDGGVTTKVDFYRGCPHAHWYLMRGVELAERGRVDCIAGFAWLLNREVSREAIKEAITFKGGPSLG